MMNTHLPDNSFSVFARDELSYIKKKECFFSFVLKE